MKVAVDTLATLPLLEALITLVGSKAVRGYGIIKNELYTFVVGAT